MKGFRNPRLGSRVVQRAVKDKAGRKALRDAILVVFVVVCLGFVAFSAFAQNPQTKTFPLHKEFPATVLACDTEEDAREILNTHKEQGIVLATSTLNRLIRESKCGMGRALVTYKKKVYEVETPEGTMRLYEGTIGEVTIYLITDWKDESVET